MWRVSPPTTSQVLGSYSALKLGHLYKNVDKSTGICLMKQNEKITEPDTD